jgi:hypothetical protein
VYYIDEIKGGVEMGTNITHREREREKIHETAAKA